MEHIQDVYTKKPEMIEKIFDHLTKVNLKVDGKPFQVLYNEDTDELEYHGRSGNETKVGPMIDDMYRLFSKPINDAIKHIEARKEVFKKYKFLTFEVISEMLLLTAIITKDGEFIDDPDKIDNIAEELDTDVMPCLWKGRISAEQKHTLMEAISTNVVPTKDEFVKWVKALFGTYDKFPKTLISRSSEYIEGIVFFYNVDGKVVEYKLVDPTFRQSVKDNQSNMKADNEANGEKYKQIYEIFVDWAKDNASKLDNSRMKSIELNFIEMMEDPKRYNKLMSLATGLTTITTDAYFLQPDRISDELKKAIQKHGKVYQLLYEKFVRLFWKAKKKNFTISKEFQQDVNKICGMVGESLEDNEYIEMINEAINYNNEIDNLINYLNEIKEKNNINNTVKTILKTFKSLNTSEEFENNFNTYCKNHGINIKTAKHLLNELSDEGYDLAHEIINKIQNKDKDVKRFEKPINTNFYKIFGNLGFNKSDIDILLNHTQKLGDSSNESDGAGEHAVALLFPNTKKASEKGDIEIQYGDNDEFVSVEFKFSGGVMSSPSCTGTAREIWNRIANKFNKKIEWKENSRLYTVLMSWWPFDEIEHNIKSHSEYILSSINIMYNKKLDCVKSDDIESMLKLIYSEYKSIKRNNNITKKEEKQYNTIKRNIINKLIRLVGCICLKAYSQFEEFNDILIYNQKENVISYIEDVEKITLKDLFNNTSVSFSGAPKSSFGGGGMSIKANKNNKINIEQDANEIEVNQDNNG